MSTLTGPRARPHDRGTTWSGIDIAGQVVDGMFTTPVAVIVAGSSVTGRATPSSDVDVVVVLAGPPAPYRQTLRTEAGALIELFVHTAASTEWWLAHERDAGMCVLAHMLASGTAIRGDGANGVQAAAREWILAGPKWSPEQLEYRRYALTAEVDDLTDADGGELVMVAGRVLVMAAELVLASRSLWLGTGKWLWRRLSEADPVITDELLASHRSAVHGNGASDLVTAAGHVLNVAGGPLREGFAVR